MKKTSLTLAGLALAATASQAQVDFTLQVLHASDLEGGIEAISRAPNFAAIASELDTNLPTGVDGSLIVSAGDNYIPGPFFNAAGDSAIRGDLQAFYQDLFGEPGLTNIREGGGRLDIAIMNAIGFDASAIGNHEFDLGSDTFESIIEEDVRGSTLGDIRHLGAQFPYLSANLDFSGDGDLSNLFTSAILPSTDFALSPADAISGGNPPKIAEATVVEVAPGEFVGVVGATTQRLQIISSPSGTIVEGSPGGNDIPLLATQLQPVINDVIDGADNMLGNSDDVNKIVLVTHLQQLSRERQLAQLLEGVDIIVAGGSDSVLANADDVTSDTPTEQYPVIETGVDGNPVAIVSTNGEYSYLGQLVVPFDASGVLADTDADLDFDLDDLNLMINGPIESTDANVIALYGSLTTAFAPGTTGAQVEALVNSVTDVVNALDGLIAGYTALFIEGRREFVRSEETNMGNLTADANLWAAQQIDPSVQISFKNGGGIRAPIGAIDGVTGELLPTQPNPAASKPLGAVSQLDISNTLRFNNDLVTIELTGAGLLRILEHGFGASFLDATTDTFPATEGRYPQIGGLQVAYQPPVDTDGDGTIDLAVEILSIALTNLEGEITQVLRQDGAWVGTAETDSYTLVGLDFSIENNGDGYPFTDDDNDTPGDTSDDTDGVAVGNTVNPLLDNTGDNPELEEQEALFSFLQTFFGTPELAYSARETSPMADARIQNLEMRRNTVGVDFPVIPGGAIRLEPIASFDAQSFDESAAEIGAYDAVTQRVFVTSADGQLVRVLDASDVADGNFPQVDTIPAPFMDFEPNSVATFRGPLGAAVAVAWSDETGTAGRGHVTLHNPDTLANIGTPIEVGFLPDMLTFTPDGTKLVVANEGEMVGSVNPEGSISVIDFALSYADPTHTEVTFNRWDRRENVLRARGVLMTQIEVGDAASVSEDLEPEYIAVSTDGNFAYVSLQENNAIALVDLQRYVVRNILPLGTVDFGSDQRLDASDEDGPGGDGEINITFEPGLFGLPQPDAIAVVPFNGTDYLLTANEGDARDYEELRLKDVGDPGETMFTLGSVDPALQADAELGRLEINLHVSDVDGDQALDTLAVFGGRNVNVYAAPVIGRFRQVNSTRSDFEDFIASTNSMFFNANNDENDSFESRSDAKAGEPEALTVATLDGRTYAFVGLERQSAIFVYDVTDPTQPVFQNLASNRNFVDASGMLIGVGLDGSDVETDDGGDAVRANPAAGDLGPESIVFVPAADSPTGGALIIVCNEVSGTVTVYSVLKGI